MNRLTLHHSGGTHKPNATDLRAYHRVVDGSGVVHEGQFAIENNAPGRIRRGHYAAHTARLNTGNIGVALACMAGSQWSNPRAAKWFPTEAQVNAALKLAADLCIRYAISPSRENVLTHAEVEITLGVKQRNKWDFDYDPFGRHTSRDPIRIGDELRDIIRGHMGGFTAVTPSPRKVLRRGSTGGDVAYLQSRLGITSDGAFGPATDAAVRKFQSKHGLLPDGVVGRMTWAELERT